MRYLFVVFVACTNYFCSYAQLAIIQDPDGYVNIRSKPDTSGEVLMKATPSDILFCFEEEGGSNWYAVDVYDSLGNTYGYIHRSRVKFIHDYKPLFENKLLNDQMVFKNKTIQVEVKTKPFDPKANTVEYTEEGTTFRYVKTVNHKGAWGIDGNVPKVAYEYINVTIDGKKITLPKEAYDQFFEPTLDYMNVNYDSQKDILYIRGLNSDGAGAYVFVIIIKNKKFEKTVTMIPF